MTNKGILRLTCSGLFVFIWLSIIKDSVCHALNPQKYPTGITAMDANAKCDTYGLVNDQLVLTEMSELYGLEFWTGQGVFTKLTPWIEIMGCFLLKNPQTTVFTTTSPGSCEQGCSTVYFGFSREQDFCWCFVSEDIQWTSSTNISSCKTSNVETVLVYKIYNGTIKQHEVEHGLCSTLTCTDSDVFIDESLCEANPKIQGVCEDGNKSSSGQYWTLSQNKTFKNCWNQNKLLLNSSACHFFEHILTAPAWTNVFREEIEVEKALGDGKEIPKYCLSAQISMSDTGKYVLEQHRRNCSATLEWFVCKNDSSRESRKNNKDAETASSHGAVIGGSVGAVIVILFFVSFIVCKVRRVGLFKRDISANTTTVTFTKSAYNDKTNIGIQTQHQVNQSYGLVNQVTEKNNKTNNSYAQVQKVKHLEDTYADSSNGEYDHLYNIGRRQPKTSENTYDSNAAVRNRNDPTYDTATSSTTVDTDNTYDHSFSNMKDYSGYEVSDTSMQIARTN